MGYEAIRGVRWALDGLMGQHRIPVDPVRRHGVVGIDHSDQLGELMDIFPLDSMRIAASIEPFMMLESA